MSSGKLSFRTIVVAALVLQLLVVTTSAALASRQTLGDASYKTIGHRPVQDFGSYVLSKNAKPMRIKERLQNKGGSLFREAPVGSSTGIRSQLLSEAHHIDSHTSMPKLDYGVSPLSYSQFFLNSDEDQPILNKDMVKKIIQKDSTISQRVEDYFGGKVRFQCEPKNKDPQLVVGQEDSIVGTFTLTCNLASDPEEPIYTMDLDLEFTIHPDQDKDEEFEFGDMVSVGTGMTPTGELKTVVQLTDQPPQMMFPPEFMDMWGDLFGEIGELGFV